MLMGWGGALKIGPVSMNIQCRLENECVVPEKGNEKSSPSQRGNTKCTRSDTNVSLL